MPRNKIKNPEDLPEAADLPQLTEQQMDWVRARLEGKNASEAYREAYDCKDMAPRTIWAEASRINTNPDVAAWLSAARKACLDTGRITIEGHCGELARLREIALETGNVGAAVLAETNRGKVAGHYIERFEDVTPVDPISIIERIMAIDPTVGRALARKHGINLIEQQPVEAA